MGKLFGCELPESGCLSALEMAGFIIVGQALLPSESAIRAEIAAVTGWCGKWIDEAFALANLNRPIPDEDYADLVETMLSDDELRISCDSCEMLSIQGVACHEIGCPNSGARFEDGCWVRYRECFICGYDAPVGQPCDCTRDMEDDE